MMVGMVKNHGVIGHAGMEMIKAVRDRIFSVSSGVKCSSTGHSFTLAIATPGALQQAHAGNFELAATHNLARGMPVMAK